MYSHWKTTILFAGVAYICIGTHIHVHTHKGTPKCTHSMHTRTQVSSQRNAGARCKYFERALKATNPENKELIDEIYNVTFSRSGEP